MRRDEVISKLKQNEDAIRDFGVAHLHLYGSFARDAASGESDVDLFFDRDTNKKLGLIELVRLQGFLEKILGTEVDVGTRTSLHPVFKTSIESNALQVF
jgi:uncharacterized protein